MSARKPSNETQPTSSPSSGVRTASQSRKYAPLMYMAASLEYDPEHLLESLESPIDRPASREYSPTTPRYVRPTTAVRYSPTSPEFSPTSLRREGVAPTGSPTSTFEADSESAGESAASSVTFGRSPSLTPPSTPITPITKVVRAVRAWGSSLNFTRHSVSTPPEEGESPIDRFESAWQNIRRAQGRDNLELAIEAFLQEWNLEDLLGLIAGEGGERVETTTWRFGIRYLDEKVWEELEPERQAEMVAQMMVDELHLPGQRLSTAAKRWRGIVGMADEVRSSYDEGPDYQAALELEEAVYDRIAQAVQAFLDDHGLTRLIEVMEETHPGPTELYFNDMLTFENDVRVIYAPHESEADFLPSNIATILLGGLPANPLAASTTPVRGILPEWEEFEQGDWSSTASDDFATPQNEHTSFQAIEHAVSQHPVRWRRVFQRVQRHIDTYGLDTTVREFWPSLNEHLRRHLESDPQAFTMIHGRLLGPRFRAEDNVAAFVADELVADELVANAREGRAEVEEVASLTSSDGQRRPPHPPLPPRAERKWEMEFLRGEVLRLQAEVQQAVEPAEVRECWICEEGFDDDDGDVGGQRKEAHYAAHRREVGEYKRLMAAARRDRSRHGSAASPPLSAGKRKRSSVLDSEVGKHDDGVLALKPPRKRVRKVEAVVVPRTPIPEDVAPMALETVRRSSRLRNRRAEQERGGDAGCLVEEASPQSGKKPVSKPKKAVKGRGHGKK